jgi:hypothetical protein
VDVFKILPPVLIALVLGLGICEGGSPEASAQFSCVYGFAIRRMGSCFQIEKMIFGFLTYGLKEEIGGFFNCNA